MCDHDINILTATDVLSEGVNLHAANILIHFDQKWNPSKLTQRNGRIDRILKTGISKAIKLYHFQTETIIDGIIELDKKITTKQGLSEKYLKENKLVLQEIKDFEDQVTLFYETDNPNRRILQCFRTYMGDVLLEERGFIGEKVEVLLEKVEIPDVEVQIEEYHSPNYRNNFLFYRNHPEFNLLSRDAWAELSKIYNKGKSYSDPFNIEFLLKIERDEPETCNIWINKRKYLK